jgi:hypothetical protein
MRVLWASVLDRNGRAPRPPPPTVSAATASELQPESVQDRNAALRRGGDIDVARVATGGTDGAQR